MSRAAGGEVTLIDNPSPRHFQRTSTVSKSALAITEEHNDLADAAIGQLSRLNSRAAARATLDDGSSHPADIWSAGIEAGGNGLAISDEHGGSRFALLGRPARLAGHD